MQCNEQCKNFEGIKHGLNGATDRERYKYCAKCTYFIKTDDVVCRCCSSRYRFKLQKRKITRKERYQKNRENEINYSRKYYEEHREEVIKRVLDNYQMNREEYLERFKEYYRKRREMELENQSPMQCDTELVTRT